ncbi:hypothetical protein PsYK624_058380 [Phanerochaete sordida]|uniref:MYND-type domain-containing protein n=1 Tax=Phanerochaete sordida TaxID=48140 RepID=A0A9P3G7Y8_9APHY|nr:hypothetical protein PsYK624_058380 [Phanerochaete sordida]
MSTCRGSPCTYIELGLYFARVIHAALYPLWDGHKVEKIRSPQAHRSASTPWPRAPRDALPYGIDSSIAALGAWMKLHPNPIYVGLFHVLVGIFKKALVLPILRSPSLPGRFTAIAEIALGALSAPAPPQYGPGFHTFTIDVLKQVADLYVALALIFDENETRALFSRAAEQVDEGALLRTTMSVSIEAVKLIPRFQSTASSEMRDALGQWLLKFQMAATAWHAKLNLPHDIDKYTEPIVECVREMRTMYKEPAYAAYHSFQQLNFDRCCAPGCKETFAGAQRRFAACSGCNRVTYCSKECFARAWKHPEVPHRAICRTIKYIVQATKIDRSPTVHGEKAFVCLCTVLPVDRRALEDFCAHMTKLKKYLSLVSPNDDADETREEAEPASQTGCPTEKSSP